MRISGAGLARLALVGGWIAMVGCERGNARLEKLTAGITKDSAAAVMKGKPSRVDQYLVNGKYIEAMFFGGGDQPDTSSAALRGMAPVVAIGGKVVGWGWPYWDSVAAANRIQVPPPATK